MPANDLTRRLGLALPLVQAPMSGGVTTPALVAAVSEAGGLGSLGAGHMSAGAIEAACTAIRRETQRPFAVNLFVPDQRGASNSPEDLAEASAALDAYRAEMGLTPPQDASTAFRPPAWEQQIAAVLKVRPAAVSFCFGLPEAEDLEALGDAGIYLIGTATTVAEARLIEDAGLDCVVAQGFEAGGPRATFTVPHDQGLVGLMALLPQVTASVDIPVLAAGGLMTGQAMAAVLALGAAGAQLGTAFATCTESGLSAVQCQALLSAHEDGTALTEAFTGKPERALRNRFLVEAFTARLPIAPYPAQQAITSDLRRAAAEQDRPDLMALWAGQGVGAVRRCSAGELVSALASEMNQALSTMGDLAGRWPREV
ncbi:MAG: nitronate monooxygenase [Pseudomonadota bacterium]